MEGKKKGGGGRKKSDEGREEMEKAVRGLAERSGDAGFDDDDVSREVTGLTREQRVELINDLVRKGVLDIFAGKSGRVVYKRKGFDPTLDPALRSADAEEKVVYGIIKEAAQRGIWMRDIRFKSDLLPTQLNKVLKSLENKKVIKAVKSVAAHKKKVYMLYDLEPDSTLTGGSWYTGEDFESEFVDVLNQQCYRFLSELSRSKKESGGSMKGPLALINAASSTPDKVCDFITDLKISNVPLSRDDIKTILDTLVYDGKVERRRSVGGEWTYRAVEPLVGAGGVTVVPCSVCPVIHRCHQNSLVTSIQCPYIRQWGLAKGTAATVIAEEPAGAETAVNDPS